jgi:hypothetical protein
MYNICPLPSNETTAKLIYKMMLSFGRHTIPPDPDTIK